MGQQGDFWLLPRFLNTLSAVPQMEMERGNPGPSVGSQGAAADCFLVAFVVAFGKDCG